MRLTTLPYAIRTADHAALADRVAMMTHDTDQVRHGSQRRRDLDR
jgi:hypothetical protein